MATELAPYKGFSMFMAYMTVPLFQMVLSHFLSYRGILVVFIILTSIAIFLAYHFRYNIHYTPFGQKNEEKIDSQVKDDEIYDNKAIVKEIK